MGSEHTTTDMEYISSFRVGRGIFFVPVVVFREKKNLLLTMDTFFYYSLHSDVAVVFGLQAVLLDVGMTTIGQQKQNEIRKE